MTKRKENPQKGGRPKEGLETLPEGWEQLILDIYSEGGADIEVKAIISKWRGRYSNQLWARWLEEEPTFLHTVQAGRQLSEAWWVKHLREQATEGRGNVTATMFAMKNRWPDQYRERKELAGSVTHKHTAVSSLDEWIEDLIRLGEDSDESRVGKNGSVLPDRRTLQ